MKNRSVRTQISASPGHAKDHALYFFAEDGLGALNLQPAAGTGRWPIESIVLRQVTVQHAAEQLEARRATLPPAGLEMLSTLNSLAMLYKANAQHDKAEPICEQILEASRKRYGEAHRDTMAAAAELGVTSLKMHHADRGQQLLRQVGDWCLAQPAGDQVAAALANIALPPLIASYHETAKQALAREWEAKLNALKQSDGSWQWEIERQLTAITRELASVTDAPPRAKLLKSRGMQKLKLSRFEEADADFQQSLELDQKDDFLKYQHACLLAYLGNSDPWAQYCNTLLNGQLPAVVVSRTAKACLLLDPPAADPKKLLAMTEQAIAQAATAKTVPSTVAWYHHTHALALYRTGNFTACLAAIDKSEEIKPIPVEREPISKLLRAMALHRMGRHEQATAAFDQGINLIERKLSPLHTFDTEKSGIENWLVAQIFRRQAETLFRAPSTNPATNTSR
jgi:tetratricopeptide (TPR) repeat protein